MSENIHSISKSSFDDLSSMYIKTMKMISLLNFSCKEVLLLNYNGNHTKVGYLIDCRFYALDSPVRHRAAKLCSMDVN